MTDWGQILQAALAAHSGLAALVGTRIYRGIAPAPMVDSYLTWIDTGITADATHSTAGYSAEYEEIQVQLTAWATRADTAAAVREQAKLCLCQRTHGTGGAVGCTLANQLTTYDPEAKLYGAILQVRLHVQHQP